MMVLIMMLLMTIPPIMMIGHDFRNNIRVFSWKRRNWGFQRQIISGAFRCSLPSKIRKVQYRCSAGSCAVARSGFRRVTESLGKVWGNFGEQKLFIYTELSGKYAGRIYFWKWINIVCLYIFFSRERLSAGFFQ